MVTKTFTATLIGLDCQLIEAEVDVRQGLNHFVIVGLGDKSIQEAKERIVSALRNSDVEYIPKRIIVNLAPADIPKTGPGYDLAIAMGYLLSTEQVQFDPVRKLFLGELALDGQIRAVNGVLALVDGAKKLGFTQVFVPCDNAAEAALITGIEIIPVKSLKEVILHMNGQLQLHFLPEQKVIHASTEFNYDLKHVKGQLFAKRALEIAAAGGHNVLFSGVPGSGKTLLAKCMPSILPPPTESEQIEITKIFSVAGALRGTTLLSQRPFRAPHHTSSSVALVGGGTIPKPGEISLAHQGVLFLDELPEFSLAAIEALRQPLEDKVVTISRAARSVTFPANFILIAAMNPCKCGYLGDPHRQCECNSKDIKRYLGKISGPILDRIDLIVKVPKVELGELDSLASVDSQVVRQKVVNSRYIQYTRYIGYTYKTNSLLSSAELTGKGFLIDTSALSAAKKAVESLNLSMRAYFRVLKVARTIADLDSQEVVLSQHVLEALAFRQSNLA